MSVGVAIALVGVALALAAALAQLALPQLAGAMVARQLAANGGQATVLIKAWPAIRLIYRSGDSITVRGSGLVMEMTRKGDPAAGIGALDRFEHVDVVLEEFETGPFSVRRFELERVGEEPYEVRSLVRTSGAGIAEYGAALGITGSGTIAEIAKRAPLVRSTFDVEVTMQLRSVEGRYEVTGGGGKIAGYPAGPIAAAITGAVVRRLRLGF
jgi:hypothetical protein